MPHHIYFGDNLDVLQNLPSGAYSLIYIDPPFNTGRTQSRTQLRTERNEDGDRTGFGGQRYTTIPLGSRGYVDLFDDYLAFIEPRLLQAHRLLTDHGSLFFHIDYREAHYVKILLDSIFGRECFLNEIIWAYDYGGRTSRKFPPKHDTIFWYARNADSYIFNRDAIDRIPYMAPGLVGKEKAARGKLPTDVWWHTIVPTNSREKTGYPTQKPLGILRRIIAAASNPDDQVLDFFAGSGTTGAACVELGRQFTLVDNNPQAMEVMEKRFDGVEGVEWHGWQTNPNR